MMTPEQLLKKHDLYKLKSDLFALAEQLKFSVVIQEYETEAPNLIEEIDPNLRGYIFIKKEMDCRIISIDKTQSLENKRLTIAYLISAYLLNGNDNHYCLSLSNNYELDALNYAKDLLIPNELLENELFFFGIDNYDQILKEFSVPDFIFREKVKTYRRKQNEII